MQCPSKIRWPSLAFGTMVLAVGALAQTARADDGTLHRDYQDRPMELGVSGSSLQFFEVGGVFYCFAGTLGGLVEDASNPSQLFVLSNNHVLARENMASIGEEIIQQGLLDENGDPTSCSAPGTDYTGYVMGHLSDFVPLNLKVLPVGKPDNEVDAAIAEVSASDVSNDGSILDVGVLDPNPAAAVVDMSVMKSGRTTGMTHGVITAVDVTIAVGYSTGYGVFKNQIRVVPNDGTGPFIAGGDSGSLLLTDPADPNLPQAVGLLFAGNADGTEAFANPIATVLSQLNVNMAGCDADIDCGGSSSGSGSGSGSGSKGGKGNNGGSRGPSSEFAPLGLDVARAAKAAHEQALLAIEGVVGVGVGVDDNGDAVVEIYVIGGGRMPAESEFPDTLDGVDVKVIQTGVIRAL